MIVVIMENTLLKIRHERDFANLREQCLWRKVRPPSVASLQKLALVAACEEEEEERHSATISGSQEVSNVGGMTTWYSGAAR